MSADRHKWLAMAVGALGVVYGDIGTSPLYAVKECFHGMHAIALNEVNVLGVLSLIFWSLTVVVGLKYATFFLMADNRGEGGIFALLALLPRSEVKPGEDVPSETVSPKLRTFVILAAIFGAALLYGDGIITPAISVLSAIEGLSVATTAAQPVILPLTCVILFVLFMVQKRGTGAIGQVFGPVMVIWFVSIALLGIRYIVRMPIIFEALNPYYALNFFKHNGMHGMVVLGSVVLCITGGEALYADMGHFGRKGIRLSWFSLVYPCLLINYFGQGALLLTDPSKNANPFYGLVPEFLLYPAVGLATAATVIASQAMISGAFSLTRQAVQLGFCPRVRILHTSSATHGQIYIPAVNIALMIGCLLLVLIFKESSRLAGAYGIAVTATMGITSLIYYFVIHKKWHWQLWKAIPLVGLFFVFDISYISANLLKILDGGWITLVIALAVTILMAAWRRGREELRYKMESSKMPISIFIEDVEKRKPYRTPGTAVFMSVSLEGTPAPLLHHYKHNKVLHERILLLTIRSAMDPVVTDAERLRVKELGEGFYRVVAVFGFMETPSIPKILELLPGEGIELDMQATTFFLGRETILPGGSSKMAEWRKRLFIFMTRNAGTPTAFFGIPPSRVIEMGSMVNL